ncbi:hypothetical protein [Halorubellus sp. PRR65]|uniref:hypothetical protein n=1 Tax=Halorubellus sp. PRR65 TaxID=3098148 RepID=UPI002B2588E1|nr:hypothetical protein [Halorubellus sp. PRR65]
MTEQIVITLDETATITKEEWKDFVRAKRGKWRGVASEEAEAALLQYMDGSGSDAANEDTEKKRLEQENERLHAENERLTNEIQRLRSSSSPSSSADSQMKNDSENPTKITDNEGDFWDDYDADEFDGEVPSEEIKQMADRFDPVGSPDEFAGEQVVAVDPDHIPETVPQKPGAARTALIAGVLRQKGDIVRLGDMVAIAKQVTGNDTTSYVRQGLVLGNREDAPEPSVVDWLAAEHPERDGSYLTAVDAWNRYMEESEMEAQRDRERLITKIVGVAFAAPQHLDEGLAGRPHVGEKYRDTWQEMRDYLSQDGEMSGVTCDVIESALLEVCGNQHKSGRMGGNGVLDEEWVDTAEEMVAWYQSEKDADFDEELEGIVIEDIGRYEPDGRVAWNEMESVDDREESADLVVAEFE